MYCLFIRKKTIINSIYLFVWVLRGALHILVPTFFHSRTKIKSIHLHWFCFLGGVETLFALCASFLHSLEDDHKIYLFTRILVGILSLPCLIHSSVDKTTIKSIYIFVCVCFVDLCLICLFVHSFKYEQEWNLSMCLILVGNDEYITNSLCALVTSLYVFGSYIYVYIYIHTHTHPNVW